MRPLVPPYIETLKPYVPGKPIEETKREYGIADVIKLASNENPLGPSPKAVEAMREALAESHLYPDASSYYLIGALSKQIISASAWARRRSATIASVVGTRNIAERSPGASRIRRTVSAAT